MTQSFVARVTDEHAGSASQAITVTILGANDRPVAANDSKTVEEGSELSALVPFAADVDGSIQSYRLVSGLASGKGTLLFNGNGSYLFKADSADFSYLRAGQSETVSFSYTATDNNGAVSEAKVVTLTVTGANSAPVAGASSQSTSENVVLYAQVPAATDVDSGIDASGYGLATGLGLGNGTLVFNADGSYAFSPGTDFDTLALGATRSVSFSYTAKDEFGKLSPPATVTITVNGSNDAPTAVSMTPASTQGQVENASAGAVIATLATTDIDVGDSFTYSLATGSNGNDADNGLLVIDGSSVKVKGGAVIDYETNKVLQFYITATDANGLSTSQAFTINVLDANDNPTVAAALTAVASEGSTQAVSLDLLTGAADVDPSYSFSVGSLSYLINGGVASETMPDYLSLAGTALSLNPAHAFFDDLKTGATRTITASYLVLDGSGGSVAQTASFIVTGTNDAPTGMTVTDTGDAGQLENASAGTVIATLATTDVDVGDTFTYSLTTGSGGNDADNGLLEISGNEIRVKTGALIDHETNKALEFYITATDAGGQSTSRAVTIAVINANDAPSVAAPLTASATEGAAQAVSLSLLTGATDPDSGTAAGLSVGTLSYKIDSGAYGASIPAGLTLNDTLLSLDPANASFDNLKAGATRTVTASYLVFDTNGASVAQTATFTVTGTNDAPTDLLMTDAGDAGQVENASPNTVIATLATTDVDVDDTFTYTLVAGSGGNDADNNLLTIVGSSVMVKSGAVIDYETHSVLQFYVKATDAGGQSTSRAFTINVTNANEAPRFVHGDKFAADVQKIQAPVPRSYQAHPKSISL